MMRNKEKGAACAFGMWSQGLLWGAAGSLDMAWS